MERGILKFHWIDWRDLIGVEGSLQRRNVDAFRQTHPAILYWGDSWFSSPLGLNLARQSFASIQGLGMVVGKPGATAAKLFSRSEIGRMADRIENNRFDAVILSAGGNDTLSDRLERVFKRWFETDGVPTIDAAAANQILQSANVLSAIHSRYSEVLDALLLVRASHPTLQVIGHTYTRIIRIGVPADLTVANIGLIALIKDDVGPWLWQPMQRVLHDKEEGRKFAAHLIEGFRRDVMQRLADTARYAGFFSFVDFVDAPEAAQPEFWNDEIHPNSAGFAVLGALLNSHLRSVLPAAKRAAVR